LTAGDDRLPEIFDQIEDVLAGKRAIAPDDGDCAMNSLISAPATNDFSPAPVMTIARTASSRLSFERGAAQLVESGDC
jgi:hypothetical protein